MASRWRRSASRRPPCGFRPTSSRGSASNPCSMRPASYRGPCRPWAAPPSRFHTPNYVHEESRMTVMTNFKGIIPAIAVPFRKDHSIDEAELARFATWLARRKGIVGLMTNGHTGEVFSLTAKERADVTRITARAINGICPTVSSVVCEGIKEGIEHALMAKEAGATALDIMPPHHWLRFGFKREHCLDYFTAIGEATKLPLIVHVYPAWTRASFSSELLAELARSPHVQAFKIGTREMNKYARDIKSIRAAAPQKALPA